jgi:hypothetical protein
MTFLKEYINSTYDELIAKVCISPENFLITKQNN